MKISTKKSPTADEIIAFLNRFEDGIDDETAEFFYNEISCREPEDDGQDEFEYGAVPGISYTYWFNGWAPSGDNTDIALKEYSFDGMTIPKEVAIDGIRVQIAFTEEQKSFLDYKQAEEDAKFITNMKGIVSGLADAKTSYQTNRLFRISDTWSKDYIMTSARADMFIHSYEYYINDITGEAPVAKDSEDAVRIVAIKFGAQDEHEYLIKDEPPTARAQFDENGICIKAGQ